MAGPILKAINTFRWLPVVLMVGLVSVVVIVIQGASPSSAQPKVTWSQEQIEVVLSPGESTTTDITFRSSGDLQGATIEAVSALAPFVTIQPNAFPQVSAGGPQQIHLSIAIPPGTALGTYDGTVHLRIGSQTLPQTIKIVVQVWNKLMGPGGVVFSYPPTWMVWPSHSPDENLTIANVPPDSQSIPESFSGVCKMTFRKFTKPSGLSLLQWVQAEIPDTLSSSLQTINVNGVSGVKESGGEIAPTDTVYFPLSETVVLSGELICGSDTKTVGNALFEEVISTFNLQP